MESGSLSGTLIGAADLAVLLGLLALMVGMGFFFRRGQGTAEDFFLGGRRLPIWAACLSFVATEVSAVTVISVPATACNENWQYLQFFIGSTAARLVIAFLFIPAFYKFNCTTIYQFLGARFGRVTQTAASFFFFLTRLLGSGVRLMAACLALSVLLNTPILPVIAVFVLVGVAYMSLGGMKAVVWTNVIQAMVFIGGGLATLAFLGHTVAGGWPAIWSQAGAAGHTAILEWGPARGTPHFWRAIFANPNIFWIAVLNGFFGSLAAFGTDQDLMQRLLTLETRKDSQKTMVGTIGVSLGVLTIYLTIGTGLYVYFRQPGSVSFPANPDAVFPHFIGHVMPSVLKGWLLSAIVLAGIDSPLASLATSFVTDLYRPYVEARGRRPTDREILRWSRWGVAVFGLVLAALAYGFSFYKNILWLAFKIGGVTFGSLLGVFLLGLLTRRRSDRWNAVAMIASALLNLVLLVLSEKKILPMGWSWLVVLGTATTLGLASLLSRPGPREGAAA